MQEGLVQELQEVVYYVQEQYQKEPQKQSPSKALLEHQLKRTIQEKNEVILQTKKTHEQIFGQLKRQIDELQTEKKKDQRESNELKRRIKDLELENRQLARLSSGKGGENKEPLQKSSENSKSGPLKYGLRPQTAKPAP